jgi:hypothetical protein
MALTSKAALPAHDAGLVRGTAWAGALALPDEILTTIAAFGGIDTALALSHSFQSGRRSRDILFSTEHYLLQLASTACCATSTERLIYIYNLYRDGAPISSGLIISLMNKTPDDVNVLVEHMCDSRGFDFLQTVFATGFNMSGSMIKNVLLAAVTEGQYHLVCCILEGYGFVRAVYAAALSCAVSRNRCAIVEVLLAALPPGCAPLPHLLFNAVRRKGTQLLDILCRSDKVAWNPEAFVQACCFNNTEAVRLLLGDERLQTGAVLKGLSYACYFGHLVVCTLLHDRRVPYTSSSFSLAFRNACKSGCLTVIQALLATDCVASLDVTRGYESAARCAGDHRMQAVCDRLMAELQARRNAAHQ